MYFVNDLINSIDPWWLIFAALILISIDWILLDSEIFLILGIAVMKLALVMVLFPSFNHSVWLIPLFLATSFFFQRNLLRPLILSKQPDEEANVVGLRGSVIKSTDQNESKSVFFDNDVAIEDKNSSTIETASIVLADGRKFTVSNPQDVSTGATVKITQHNNGIVTVKEI
jgi:membrane protein implicated in regulation of membrane protease activity